jgi:rSAM/selenodomain-associated transferase 1
VSRTSNLAASNPPHADSAVVILAKAPIPGQVKTRLCPPLTPDEAATLQGSFVLDIVEKAGHAAGGAGWDRFIACAPFKEHVFFKVLAERYGLLLLDQIGDDLGLRMAHTFDELFARGYRHVVMVGTDVPTLGGTVFGQAFDRLTAYDVVLGPAIDGGYWLIGLRASHPELFSGIPWSTDQVRAVTQQKAALAGLTATLLAPCRDVDRFEDILAVAKEAGLLSKRTADVLKLLLSRHLMSDGKTEM